MPDVFQIVLAYSRGTWRVLHLLCYGLYSLHCICPGGHGSTAWWQTSIA
jgi:hypothetical protein